MQTKTKWIIGGGILGTVILTFVGLKIRKNIRLKQATNAVSKASASKTGKLLGINIPELATQIGMDLGYAYPSYDPRHWTENDEAVKVSVLHVPKPQIPQLVDAYRKKYSRNLQEDLQEKLDDYNEISYLFK